MSSINAATSVSNAQLGYEVGIAVAKKTLDAAKQQGAAAVSLLESAAELQKTVGAQAVSGVGGSIDVRG